MPRLSMAISQKHAEHIFLFMFIEAIYFFNQLDNKMRTFNGMKTLTLLSNPIRWLIFIDTLLM
jgi:hypothetical protein